MPLGYEVVMFEQYDKPGGLMRSNIPSFRLPDQVLEEETQVILDMGVEIRYNTPVTSLRALLDEGFDAIFVGVGAPRGKELDIPGRYDEVESRTSTSASTGSSRSPSVTSIRSASASSSSASATRRWTAVARRVDSAAPTSRSWRDVRASTSRPRPGSSTTPRKRASRSS